MAKPFGIAVHDRKAATALADFIVLDMFANVATGREEPKSAMRIAERQAQRLYRFLAYPLGLGVWLSFTDAPIGRDWVFIGLAAKE